MNVQDNIFVGYFWRVDFRDYKTNVKRWCTKDLFIKLWIIWREEGEKRLRLIDNFKSVINESVLLFLQDPQLRLQKHVEKLDEWRCESLKRFWYLKIERIKRS